MATIDDRIRELEEQASVVAVLRDLLRRARRGEIRHIAVACETTGVVEHATVNSTLNRPGDRIRLIGLLHMAMRRLAG